jgi:uncharacterized protein YqeY
MTESLRDRIRADLNTARRERDKLRTLVLTTTLSDVKNREIELRHDLTDPEVLEVVQRAVKRRKEASEQIRAAGRAELADKEDMEAEILKSYLPRQLAEEDVRALVREAITGGADNLGAVMSRIMPAIKGFFDGKEANRIVKEELEAL